MRYAETNVDTLTHHLRKRRKIRNFPKSSAFAFAEGTIKRLFFVFWLLQILIGVMEKHLTRVSCKSSPTVIKKIRELLMYTCDKVLICNASVSNFPNIC